MKEYEYQIYNAIVLDTELVQTVWCVPIVIDAKDAHLKRLYAGMTETVSGNNLSDGWTPAKLFSVFACHGLVLWK